MKIHFLQEHYNKKARGQLFPFLKPFIKGDNFSDKERISMYQISKNDVSFVNKPDKADICILTMSWNYYYGCDKLEEATNYIKTANKAGKQVWTWMSGDFGVSLKLKGDYIVFRNSGHRSRLDVRHVGMPVFLSDPYSNYFNTDQMILPKYQNIPLVGFCGQANANIKQTWKEVMVQFKHLLAYKSGKTYNLPQPIQSTSKLRAELLNNLERAPNIQDHFIKREKYRAGISSNKSAHQTTLEFYNNIKESHYILCVRGKGNFSVRFYETLAMGRIPVFVNTDCLLPLSDEIDWHKHCVWVEADDKAYIAQKMVEFHNSHTQSSLYQLMKANRELWINTMRIGPFFQYYFNSRYE